MTRNPVASAQRRAHSAAAEDLARQATEMVLNWALDLLNETLDLSNYASPHSEPMAKAVEKTARKVLDNRFKIETRGRKRTVQLGYFDEKFILDRGAELARGGTGVNRAAKKIRMELITKIADRTAIAKAHGIKIRHRFPTVSAIKGRLERSKR
jgi:hypothetical protein